MSPERRILGPRVGCGLILAALADGAHAHAVSAQAGAFYAGLLHPLTAPEHILAMLALGLLGGQQGLSKGQHLLLAVLAGVPLGSGLALLDPTLEWVAAATLGSAVLCGGMVAAARPVAAGPLCGLALLFGLTHGYIHGSMAPADLSPLVFMLGVVVGTLIGVGYALVGAAYLWRLAAPGLCVAVRAAGSWIVAIGLLALGSGRTALGSP